MFAVVGPPAVVGGPVFSFVVAGVSASAFGAFAGGGPGPLVFIASTSKVSYTF